MQLPDQPGLTASEVAQRVAAGRTNATPQSNSRSTTDIIKANVLTRFNALLGGLVIAVLITGHVNDAMFGVVLVSNSAIGVVQELRAKRTLDRLAVLTDPLARVVRDGQVIEIAIEDIVADDLVELRTGDQVPADGPTVVEQGLSLDESLLTGESEPVTKHPGDVVLSGSFVVSGQGWFTAAHVGADSYANRLAVSARRFSLVKSELVAVLNRVVGIIGWVIIPVGLLLAWSQANAVDGWREAVRSTVSGVVGMVPEGLILLTSVAFASAALKLARHGVLLQEIPAVEVLARVDRLCLDKTGTLTDGSVALDGLELLLTDHDEAEVAGAVGAIAAMASSGGTMAVLAGVYSDPGWTMDSLVSFSSARKWSGATFGAHGSWVMGAPEVLMDATMPRVNELAALGRRVLLVATSSTVLNDGTRPSDLVPVALVVLTEHLRPEVADTVRFFGEQGVALTVLSGDNPTTVSTLAARAGIGNGQDGFDARGLPDGDDALTEVLRSRTVFGRVTPEQKRMMVGAFQRTGQVVAMTGDGVNDVLALKDADLGIAMGSGAAATRAVAQLVLLDDSFGALPAVVAEGRRVVANIERVAHLFLTKTVYATVLALVVAVARVPFPLLPRHFTLVGSLTIGIPGFFLALAPNDAKYRPGFLARVARFAVPAGAVSAATTLAAYRVARWDGAPLLVSRTIATMVLGTIGLWVLGMLVRPVRGWRLSLVVALSVALAACPSMGWSRSVLDLRAPSLKLGLLASLVALAGILSLEGVWRVVQRRSRENR